MLADVATEIDASRLLVQRASWMARNGMPMTGGQGSMSKLKAGDVTMWATSTLIDLVGPYAQSTECPLEKWFRDAKIYQLFEGTAQVQRLVISRLQAQTYRERLAEAAEIAKDAASSTARPPTAPPLRFRQPPDLETRRRPNAPPGARHQVVHPRLMHHPVPGTKWCTGPESEVASCRLGLQL